ncbi:MULTISPECIES: acyl-CoA dehydrogenase C-terminal domain-containing protein [Sphingobium]|uniref:acyl-CoA dehydrogenase C-terminal domain-containing protein n=1 Tax=Sphingobium TaxID=165695 RepID=UPI00159C29E8|nr:MULTISPECIES: acyl-CoA dehydrogenase C-terminal domain-containing protein [unclassified Sphingobium]
MNYTAPVEDSLFVLDTVAALPAIAALPAFSHMETETLSAILSESGRFAAEVIAPLNANGDKQGCRRDADGNVRAPDGFREAYARYREAGWTALFPPEAYGGQALPHLAWLATEEFVLSANLSFGAYTGLTSGAVSAILAHGNEAQKALYLPPMVSGTWTGTMNLTEPQCGTDLNLIRTRARPVGDGTYSITGTKIFISAGEHDLSDNIVHLVLAKTEGAPDNVKGLSLFIVPKFLPDGPSTPGQRNALSCGAIEEKMGLHGNATCVMNYDGATGWLIGEETKGLNAMFVMMNDARLHVGIQGVAVAEAAYQAAVAYARERRQGRALTGAADPEQAADPLTVHPDVRRMLMECRSLVQGCRALCLWATAQSDLARHAPDADARQQATDLLSIATPVVKAFVTDRGHECAVTAQQVFGGHGYIRETGVEQLVRDARITMIYEGANGVQAMDLVGRKLWQDDGRGFATLMAQMRREIAETPEALSHLARPIGPVLDDLEAAIAWMMKNARKDPDAIGAAAYPFLELTGYAMLGWLWLKMAKAVPGQVEKGAHGEAFGQAKLTTADFYMRRLLPRASGLLAQIESGPAPLMTLAEAAF